MENKLFQLRVVMPEGIRFDGMAERVELNTQEGNIGVLKDHIPLIALVKPGIMRITKESEIKEIMLNGGIIEILQDKVTVIGSENE